jgi:hypothetical protein
MNGIVGFCVSHTVDAAGDLTRSAEDDTIGGLIENYASL